MIKVRSPFSFTAQDEQAKKDMEESQRLAELALTVAGDRARLCLSTEDFKIYRKEYKATEEKLVDALLKYNKYFLKSDSVSIEKYAMVISGYLTKIESIRSLLDVIVKDAQRGIPQRDAKQ